MSTPYLSQFTPSLMTPATLEAIFVQREAQAQRIEELIIRAVNGGERTHFLIYGPRGIGKTHLISLLFHRLQARPELADKMRIAWLREEERGVTSMTEMLLRVLKSLQKTYPQELTEAMIAELYDAGDITAIENAAKRLLARFASNKTVILIAENLDDIFNGLGKTGQGKLRAWVENTDNIVLLAATPSMKAGAQDPVKRIAGSHTEPFYAFFRQELLADFSLDEAVTLLQKIARIKGDEEQERYLKTEEGRGRVMAVHHLAGGNPRVYVILAQFLVATNLDDLTQPFLKMLDDMTPYYQSRLATLSPQQNQIMEFLCQYRAAVTVSEIAKQCLMTAQTASSQLKNLKEIGYVRSDMVGRESFYELREPLMRLSLEVKASRGGPIPLLVDFLRLWFSRRERKTILASLSPDKNPIACMYFREALSLSHITPLPKDIKKPSYSGEDKLWELVRNNQWEEALLLAEENLENTNNSLNANIWIQLGYIQDELSRYEEALVSYDRAIQIKPNDDIAWYNRGIVLDKLTRYEEALISYDKAIQIKPDYAKAWHNRGSVLDYLNHDEEALASYGRAIQINPDYAKAWYNQGVVLDKLSRYEEALASCDKAIQINPNDNDAWYSRGIVLKNLNRYEKALSSYDKAIQIKPNDNHAWHNRAVILDYLNFDEEALASYDKAIQINPDDALPYFNKARIYLRQSSWTLFVTQLIEAFTLTPNIRGDQWQRWLIQNSVLYCRILFEDYAHLNNFITNGYIKEITDIFTRNNAMSYLSQGLTESIRTFLSSDASDDTALVWLAAWQGAAASHEELTVPLQILDAAVRWKTTRGDRRVLLSLPEEIRSILQEMLPSTEEDQNS